jgi:hypothetical protein
MAVIHTTKQPAPVVFSHLIAEEPARAAAGAARDVRFTQPIAPLSGRQR